MYDFLNDAVIGVAFVVAVVAMVVVTVVEPGSLAATGLRALSFFLAGGLLGSKVPKP